jgi:farnesyl-diphosphate farnesyltransferase
MVSLASSFVNSQFSSLSARRLSCRDREDMKKCWGYLDLTSRSFAAVIKELEGDLSRVVSSQVDDLVLLDDHRMRRELMLPCAQIALFYLALRGLDTVEDDMTLSIEKKAPLLEEFYLKLEQDGWNFTECTLRVPAGQRSKLT